MIWARMLAYITGTVDQELLLRSEYLAAENRILRAKIKARLLLSDSEKTTFGRNRPPAGTEGSGRGRSRSQARYVAPLVSRADCQEVRRIEVSQIRWSPSRGRSNREPSRTDRQREPELGL